jgi:SnoaL-like domain
MSKATIHALYEAFAKLDAAKMQSLYAPQARFDDEAFSLKGPEQIGGMWRMMCEGVRTKGAAHWKLSTSDVTEHSANWDAHYKFSATGRLVHNKIHAEFDFDKNGLIVLHVDTFNFWRWSRQALGAPGLLLGWSPFLRQKVRKQAALNLQRYLEKQGPSTR